MGGRFVEPPPPSDPEKCWDSGLRVDEGKPPKTVPGRPAEPVTQGGKARNKSEVPCGCMCQRGVSEEAVGVDVDGEADVAAGFGNLA